MDDRTIGTDEGGALGVGGIRFGPAGWSYDDWAGVVYPKPRPRGFDALREIARVLDFAEVNATFYAPLAASTAARWVERVADRPGFGFAVKAWQEMTHGRRLPDLAARRAWAEVLIPLAEARRLEAVLVQFPASVRPGPAARERIRAVRDLVPEGVPVAVEHRHGSAASEEARAFLRREGLVFVNVDQPAVPGQLGPTAIATADLGYVRLHGRNGAAWFDVAAGRNARYDYRYSAEELVAWTARLRRLRAATRRVLVVGNNHFEGQAVAAVLELASRMLGEPVVMPEPLLARFPDLSAFAKPAPGCLF